VPALTGPRRARARWVGALALGASLTVACAQGAAAERVLVALDGPGVPSDARIAATLDGDVERLPGGWRSVELDERTPLRTARRKVDDLPGRVRVLADPVLRPALVPDDPLFAPGPSGYQWSLRNTGAAAGSVSGADIDAVEGWDAAGDPAEVVVAVIDSGLQHTHPDLAARIWSNPGEVPANGVDDDGNGYVDDVRGWDFLADDGSVYDHPFVDDHGTHVAGIIGASRGDGVGMAGIAPNARIMPLKFIGAGGGYTSDAIAAIEYAVGEEARVMNMSFGGDAYSPALCDAIAWAAERGVLSIVAAGNDGADTDVAPSWPAACPEASLISVAATDHADRLAGFSNRGAQSVDVAAPGDAILSTVPGSEHAQKSGTSMAAPHVSGVAAVLAGRVPSLAPWQLARAIVDGGDALPELATTTSGGRRISLLGALAQAGAAPSDTVAPSAPRGVRPGAGTTVTEPRPPFAWVPGADAHSGIDRHELVVDGVAVATVVGAGASARPAVDLAPGPHAWHVVAVDRAGNRTAGAESAVTVVAPGAPPPAAESAVTVVAPGAPPPAAAPPAPTLRLGAPTAVRRGARPILRIHAHRAGAGTVTISRGSRSVGTFRFTAREGWNSVRVPAALAGRLRAGAHIVRVRLGGESAQATMRVRVAPASRARPSVRLRIPGDRVGGRRPVLRIGASRAGRATVTLRRASQVGRFTVRARRGWTTVRVPDRIARRLSVGRYSVRVRLAGRSAAGVLRVAAPARR